MVIDASKYVARALVLDTIPDFRVGYVYIVRDARGVLHSFSKPVQRPKSAMAAALYYVLVNGAAQLAVWTRLRGRSIKVRYEDLVAEPGRELERIGRFLGLDMSGVIASIAAGEPLDIGHMVSGNRIRTNGVIKVGSTTSGAACRWCAGSAITWPACPFSSSTVTGRDRGRCHGWCEDPHAVFRPGALSHASRRHHELFGHELIGRGHEIDFVMQAASPAVPPGPTPWNGRTVGSVPRGRVGGSWAGSGISGRRSRTSSAACARLAGDRYDAIQVRDKFLIAAWIALTARGRGQKFLLALVPGARGAVAAGPGRDCALSLAHGHSRWLLLAAAVPLDPAALRPCFRPERAHAAGCRGMRHSNAEDDRRSDGDRCWRRRTLLCLRASSPAGQRQAVPSCSVTSAQWSCGDSCRY